MSQHLQRRDKLRRQLLGLPEKAPETEEFDLVVVGGGNSGVRQRLGWDAVFYAFVALAVLSSLVLAPALRRRPAAG